MSEFEIHQATLEDIDDLSLLFDAYRVFYGKESDVTGAKKFLTERISNLESIVYICRKDEVATGFVQLYPLFSSTRMKRLWLLNDLFVAPKYRGQGMSVALIDTAKKLSEKTNACGVSLETAKDNIIGNNLYVKTQFELEEDHNYYFYTTLGKEGGKTSG